ncbi:hypothetical protein [Bifidobacterium callitrichidarum]|uniref:hypothetical protein n=1 Tax=Bifidobacterium callitrichidarum TaxID=2052941 RepID=UPI0011B1F121|nr:hypothetical protein [Bifidobacterium callitrichidarum]
MKAKARWNLILLGFLIALITLFILPASTWAMVPSDGGAKAASSSDLILMLPSGRWAQQIGSITARTEPADFSLGSFMGNITSSIMSSMRLILPNMLLMISQMCWSTALSLSQFAASFDPIDTFGSKLDKSIGNLVDSLMSGGIPAVLIFMGVFAWIGAAAFNIGSSAAAVKRIGVTILCLATLVFTGSQATKDGDSSTPTVGSPWWTVSTINSAVNTLAFGINLDGLADNDSNMMAAKNPKKYSDVQNLPNCQTYLYQMHKAYDAAAKKTTSGTNTSSVTKAVNRMWEETALRSWVTMQYGNPAADNTTTTPQVAANAQQAYCHVLESYAHTNTEEQRALTNKQLGTNIESKTAKYLFNPDLGFIDPWNTKVNTSDKPFDRGTDIYNQRAAIFWETCSASGGKGIARRGWAKLIHNLGDDGSGAIQGGGGKYLRAERKSGSKLYHVVDQKSPILSDTISDVCNAVFTNQIYQGAETNTPTDGNDGTNYKGLAVGDSAGMGWRFDVPNVGMTWREANMESGIGATRGAATAADVQGVITTTDFMYGNSKIDTQGALGSMLGAICNMIVWGLLSLFLIVSKLMLTFCLLSLIVAFLVAAVPVGERPRKVLIKWAKGCVNFSMVGILYSVLGSVATCICQLVISATGMVSSSFFYNLLTGISPLLALIIIALTCGMLGLGNPFSIKAIASMAGAGALYSGITKHGRQAAFEAMHDLRHGHGKNSKAEDGRASSKANGNGNAQESAEVLRKGSSKPKGETEVEEKDTKAEAPEKAEAGGTVVAKAEAGGTVVAKAGTKDAEEDSAGKENEEPEEEKEKALLGGTRWADQDENTIRGDLGRRMDASREKWREHKANHDLAIDAHKDQEAAAVMKYIKKGMTPDEAMAKAHNHRVLKDLASHTAHYGGAVFRGAVGTPLAAGMALATSKPIRNRVNELKPIAKTAAKAAVTVAALSNPVTAGVGVLMAAKMATNRQNLSNAGKAVDTTYRVGKSAVVGLPQAVNNLRTNSKMADAFRKADGAAPQSPVDYMNTPRGGKPVITGSRPAPVNPAGGQPVNSTNRTRQLPSANQPQVTTLSSFSWRDKIERQSLSQFSWWNGQSQTTPVKAQRPPVVASNGGTLAGTAKPPVEKPVASQPRINPGSLNTKNNRLK